MAGSAFDFAINIPAMKTQGVEDQLFGLPVSPGA